MIWYLYIVECSDSTLYCGVTNNVERRIEKHNKGLGARYTRARMPVKLKYIEKYLTKGEALKREHRIKQWTRRKKLSLIQRDFEKLSKLSH
jgi:putative endonuclease